MLNMKVEHAQSNDADLYTGKVADAHELILAAIQKAAPTCPLAVAMAALGAASSASSLSAAVGPILSHMRHPAEVKMVRDLFDILIQNSVVTVYQVAQAIECPRETAEKALEAAGEESFRLTHEGIQALSDLANDQRRGKSAASS